MIVPWPRPRAFLLTFLLLLPFIYIGLFHVLPAVQNQFKEWQEWQREPERLQRLLQYFYNPQTNLSVNLIVATTAADDISWTSNLRIPNLQIIRYVSDDPNAQYHPPVAKGREALMYFTYLHDFYDNLPDVSIFVHAHETAWHVDTALQQSMTFALSRLDVQRVVDRQYFNLRVTWGNGCPVGINTTKTQVESTISEEPFMAYAFQQNFGVISVPELLAGPCCSQFAVTRDAIRSRSKGDYKHYMDWLITTDWSDYIAGRVWEHMWPYLFKGEARDCFIEWKALCRMYGVCFDGATELRRYQNVWETRVKTKEEVSFWKELWNPKKAAKERKKIGKFTDFVDKKLREALEKGNEPGRRGEKLSDMMIEA